MKTSAFCILVLFILLLSMVAGAQETFRISIAGGLAKSDNFESDLYNPGFNVAITPWFLPNKNIHLGLRFAYARWTPDEDAFLAETMTVVTNPDITGSVNIYELLPSIRIAAGFEPFDLFGQFGAGLYFRDKDIRARGEALGSTVSERLIDESDTHFGFSAGIGFTLGELGPFGIEAMASYHIIDIDNGSEQFYTLGGGFYFDF